MNRHRLLLFASLAALPFMTGCDSTTSPGSQDPPAEDYTLLDSWTVGTAGATLAGESFVIDIPAGALADDTEIKLSISETDRPFGEDPGTATFKLEGLADHTAPIRVALRYQGATPEYPQIAHGTEQPDPFGGEDSVAFDLYAAADSSGFLVTHLPATADRLKDGGHGRSDLGDTHFLLGLLLFGRPLNGEFFRVLYPSSLADPEAIEEFLMELHTIVTDDLGFDFRGTADDSAVDWPINVVVRPFPVSDEYGTVRLGTDNPHRRFTLEIDERALTAGSTDISVSAGKSVLLAAMICEVNWDFGFLGDLERSWFYQAVLYWSAELFTVEDDYVRPVGFDGQEFTLFGGVPMWSSDTGSYLDYSLSMSAFVKYLTAVYGIEAPAVIVEGSQDGTPVLDTIASATGTDFGAIWSDFCDVYVRGQIYDVDVWELIEAGFAHDEPYSWLVEDADDVAHDFNGTADMMAYGGLEAKVFTVDFAYRDFGEGSELKLDTSHLDDYEDLPMRVYARTAGEMTLLESDLTDATVDLQDQLFAQDIDQVVVLLVNEAYDLGTHELLYAYDYLRCRIVQDYDYPSLYVRIFIDASVYNHDSGENEILPLFGYYNQTLTGSFDGDEFEYSEYQSYDTGWMRITATGRIDPATGTMLDFVIETNSESLDAEGTVVFFEHKKFDLISGLDPGFGFDMPMINVSYGTVCSYIEDFEFESSTYTLLAPPICGPESSIRLEWSSE